MYSFLATPYFHRLETGAFPHTGKQPSNYTVLGQSCHLVTGARNCFFTSSSILLPFNHPPLPPPKQGHCIHLLLCLQSSINSTSQHVFFFFLTHAPRPRSPPFLHLCCLPLFTHDQLTLFLFPSLFLFFSDPT